MLGHPIYEYPPHPSFLWREEGVARQNVARRNPFHLDIEAHFLLPGLS